MKRGLLIIGVLIIILLISGIDSCQTILSKCGDGKCSFNEDSSNCCIDCSCPSGFTCDGQQCKKLSECGNGIVEEGETSANCCKDAGCSIGETCQNNTCIELKPEIVSKLSLADKESVTILLSKNNKIAIGTLTLENKGNDIAKDIKLDISSKEGYFDTKTLTYNSISPDSSGQQEITLNFKDKIMEIVDAKDLSMDINIKFSNSANNQFSTSISSNIGVYGRNSISSGYPMSYAAWVTPHQNIVREFAAKSTSGLSAGYIKGIQLDLAARWLFSSMKAYGIKYVNDVPTIGDYVQLPYEVLKRRTGDCEDLAILYTSLLESIGAEPVLVKVPGHVFSGYIKDGKIVPVETTADGFTDALTIGYNEYVTYQNRGELQLIKPSDYREEYAEALITNEPVIPLPDITKSMGKCGVSFNLVDFWVASVPVQFVNSGDSPGAGCAAVVIYDANRNEKANDLRCWLVNPGQTVNVDYQADISIFENYYCNAY